MRLNDVLSAERLYSRDLERQLAGSEARAAHFESLATDQQATNEAMVASLKRGLEKLQASEAERAEAERGREQAWQAEAEQVRLKCEALDRLRAAEAEVARLREALEWYADVCHYDDDTFAPGRLVGGGWAGAEPQETDWDPDYGETARKALGLPDPWSVDALAGMDGGRAPADQARREGPDDE